MAATKIELGEAGESVKVKVAALRKQRGMSYAELSRRLEAAGRPIPALGLRRIEAGDRRVDVDDLGALAKVLDVDVRQLLGIADSAAIDRERFAVEFLDRQELIRATLVAAKEGRA